MSSSNPSTASEPQATLTPIKPSDTHHFKEFFISKSGLTSFSVEVNDAAKTHYHIDTSLYTPSKADITLYAGHDTHGKVLGDVDLRNFSGHYTIELGAPGSDAVVLEELERIKGWSSRHQFHFVFGGNEKARRQTFVWRHPGENLAENRDDLELTVDNGDDEEELLLAQYVKGHGWKGKTRLLVREGGGEKWELMVVLTVMALVVSKRREQ